MNNNTELLRLAKGDNMIDDPVVRAKQIAAEEMATASEMHYLMYAGSRLMKENVLETPHNYVQNTLCGL